jgi:hypothetical protein
MARKWSNRNLPGALHYVTGNCSNRFPVFTSLHAARLFSPSSRYSIKTITGRASARFIRKGMKRWQWIITGGGQMIQRSCRKQ